MSDKIKWACPKCGAPANKHGKGGYSKCRDQSMDSGCNGFLCECEDDSDYDDPDHGTTFSNPCPNANCYHCGFGGVFPKAPAKTPAWAKKALAEGWTPPEGWTP